MPTPTGPAADVMRSIGARIGSALPPGTAFALVIFENDSSNHTLWISNAARADTIKALAGLLKKLRAGDN